MKKVTSFLILLITLNSFCQENNLVSKISEINDLYLNQKYDQVISESKKIFSEVYGPVDDRNKLGLIPLVANSHIILENYSEAIENYNLYKEIYLKFDIKGLSLKQKEKALKSVNKTIADLKLRIPENEITTTNPKNNSTQSDSKNTVELVTSSNEESDSKNTVELVTSSNGKSRSEAIKFALRDAIEQAFGAFISSNTKIINDEIVNDEIVSVSSGNIVKYDVISESQSSNELYLVSVRATVSLTSLTTYMQDKGHEVSFSGESFGMKIKLQKLNEQSEEKAIDNMIVSLRELIKKSIDFKIEEISEPVLKTNFKGNEGEELYNIILKVSSYPNKNYNSFKNFMLETLRSLSMSENEIEDYSKLKKDVYHFIAFEEENINYTTTELLKKFEPINLRKLKEDLGMYKYKIYDFEFNGLDFKTNGNKNVTGKTKELLIENLKHFKEVSSHNIKIVSKGAKKGNEKYFDSNWDVIKINDNIKVISWKNNRDKKFSYGDEYPISSNGSWSSYYNRFEYETPWPYSIRINFSKFLRNHDHLTLRSIKSLTKIDLFLQEIQDHIFGYSLEFGDSSWSPLFYLQNRTHDYLSDFTDTERKYVESLLPKESLATYKKKLLETKRLNKNIDDYTPPKFGLPSAYDDWDATKINYNDYNQSRYSTANNSYFERLGFHKTGSWSDGVATTIFSKRTSDENKNTLFFTNLIRRNLILDNNSLYHVISLKLTLSELEKIQEFKVNNL